MGLKSSLEEEFDFDIVEEFVSHLFVMCHTMEGSILALEVREKYKKSINEVFRVAHNIKSASGFLKLTIINNFCIQLEDILSDARELDGPANAMFVDWLLTVKDQIQTWAEDIDEDKDELTILNISFEYRKYLI